MWHKCAFGCAQHLMETRETTAADRKWGEGVRGEMIKIKEAETDERGKNWDQTDNDSEMGVENTEVKTTVEVHRSINRHFLQDRQRKLSKWDVHKCTWGVSCNESNSNSTVQLRSERTLNVYQVSKSFIFYFTKERWLSKVCLVLVKEIKRVQYVTFVFHSLTRPTTDGETLN